MYFIMIYLPNGKFTTMKDEDENTLFYDTEEEAIISINEYQEVLYFECEIFQIGSGRVIV